MAEHTATADVTEVLFWDRSGQPIPLADYLRLRCDRAYRDVARDVAGSYDVITVWLGTDQGDGMQPAPLLFGTIARHRGTGEWFQDRETFSATEQDALAVHAALRAEVNATP